MPRTGPCAPWISGAQVRALPLVTLAATAALTGEGGVPVLSETQIDVACANAASSASIILYELSGWQFTGDCGPVTIRPVARPTDVDTRGWVGRMGWNGTWGWCGSYGRAYGATASHWGCSNPPTIDLGVFPVTEVQLVTINGVDIPADEYELRDFRTLIRVRPTMESVPTERYGWPTCQLNDLPPDQDGTFSVTYKYGQIPPQTGIDAALALAEAFVIPKLGDASRYPERIVSMSRQGVTTQEANPMDLLDRGQVGIWEVDLFLRSVNPEKLARPPAVWSPDLGRARRQPGVFRSS